MAEYVFTLRNVRKAHGDKVVLDNVTLSFLHGAKIGVVGPNGTGKSTLLKIMAGLDHASNGDAIIDPDATVGMLQQEPPLTEGKTVLENVEEAVGEIKGKLDRYNEISEELADPDADYDTLLAEMGDLQTDLDHANAWDLDSRLDQAMDALRCPPPEVLVDNLSGGERRRVALCKLLLQQPDLLLLDEPTNHLDAESVQWLEGHLASYPGAVLAVTHDRYFLDNVAELDPRARPRQGAPLRGQLLDLPRDQAAAAQGRGRQGRQARQDARARARVGALEPQGPAGEEQVAAGPLRGAGRRGRAQPQGRPRARSTSRPVRGSATSCSRPTTSSKGFGDRVLMHDLDFKLPRAGIVGVIGPNGVGKTTLFRMIVGEEKPDEGELKVGQTVKISYVDQSRGGIDPQQERLGGRLRRARLHQGRQLRDAEPGLHRVVRLQGPRPAEEGRRAVRR